MWRAFLKRMQLVNEPTDDDEAIRGVFAPNHKLRPADRLNAIAW
jgi:hypothetical protein